MKQGQIEEIDEGEAGVGEESYEGGDERGGLGGYGGGDGRGYEGWKRV